MLVKSETSNRLIGSQVKRADITCSFDNRLPSGLVAELGVPAAEEAAVAAGDDDAEVAILCPSAELIKIENLES